MRVYADDEFNESPMMVDDPELQEAIDLINDYTLAEFDHMGITEDTNLEDVGLMYTTHGGNDEIELQVSADLIHPALKCYISGELRKTSAYNSLQDFINSELEFLDFDSLYSWSLDFVKKDDFDPEYSSDYMEDYDDDEDE